MQERQLLQVLEYSDKYLNPDIPMCYQPYNPPRFLQNGVAMTIYTALWADYNWEKITQDPEPPYQEQIFIGAQDVPIFGLVAIPKAPRGTIVATYGITGELENQWFLKLLGRKAYSQGYAVVLFDWRGHGKTAKLSPTLTSDGLYEGEDFVRIAAAAKVMGCPGKFWFTGYSLGGQLALWAVSLRCGDASQEVESWGSSDAFEDKENLRRGDANRENFPASLRLPVSVSSDSPASSRLFASVSLSSLGLEVDEIGGAAVICPSLDSRRSLAYLVKHPIGKYMERAITRNLKKMAWQIYEDHPSSINPEAIARVNSIWSFDEELVIKHLGFSSVEAYYDASSALPLLPYLQKPTLIIYAEDDPLFDPAIVPELQTACASNPTIDLLLTRYGGHVGYISSKECQRQLQDPDPWWAWNRILQWISSVG